MLVDELARLMHGWRRAVEGQPGYAERRAAYEMVIKAHWRAIFKEYRG